MIGHQDTEIIDDGKVFVIDKDTKEISGEMLIISQFMNKSERVTLKMPRYIEGHDMLLCNYVTIHYDNVSTDRESVNSDVYEVDDLKLKEGTDDVLTFTWLITSNATQLVGTVEISVHFDCLTDGVSVYSWGTTVSRLIRILESKNNSPSVIANNSDILQQHTDKIDKLNENVEALSKKHDGDLQAANERIDTANDEIAKTNKAVENLNKSLTQSIESVGESANKAIAYVNESATQGIAEVNKKIDELPQPDLAQNDPTAKDHVKGRTHYKYIGEVDLVPEMSVAFEGGLDALNKVFSNGDIGYLELQGGESYKAYFNGEEYNLTPKTITNGEYTYMYIGNGKKISAVLDVEDTGEPFAYCYVVGQNTSMLCITSTTDVTVTFRICGETEIYEPFDGRYLPNGLGYIIKEGSQTATNTLTWDGNTEGLENIPMSETAGFYKVTDAAPSISDIVGSTVAINMGGNVTESVITEELLIDMSEEGISAFIVLPDNEELDIPVIYVFNEDFSAEGLTATKGVYFLYGVADSAIFTQSLTCLTDCFVEGTAAEVQKIDNRLLDLEWLAVKKAVEVELVPETETTANAFDLDIGTISVGDICIVYYNGVKYECEVKTYSANFDGVVVTYNYFGNAALSTSAGLPDIDTGEPFCWRQMFVYGQSETPRFVISNASAANPVTIKIMGYMLRPDKIPEEYLPDSIINSTIPEFDLVTLGLPSMTLDGEKVSLNDYNILNLCATAKNSPIKITFNVDGVARSAILRDVVITGEFYSWTAAWSNFGGASPNETANCVLKLTAWITEGQMYAWAYTVPTASTITALEARIAALEGATE